MATTATVTAQPGNGVLAGAPQTQASSGTAILGGPSSAQPQPAQQPRPSIWHNILAGALEGLAGGASQPGGLGASGGFGGIGAGFKAQQAAQQQQQDRATQQAAQQQQDARAAQDANDLHQQRLANLQLTQHQNWQAGQQQKQEGRDWGEHAASQMTQAAALMASAPDVTFQDYDSATDAMNSAGGIGPAAKGIASGSHVAMYMPDGKYRVFSGVSQPWMQQKNAEPFSLPIVKGFDPKTGDVEMGAIPVGGSLQGR